MSPSLHPDLTLDWTDFQPLTYILLVFVNCLPTTCTTNFLTRLVFPYKRTHLQGLKDFVHESLKTICFRSHPLGNTGLLVYNLKYPTFARTPLSLSSNISDVGFFFLEEYLSVCVLYMISYGNCSTQLWILFLFKGSGSHANFKIQYPPFSKCYNFSLCF